MSYKTFNANCIIRLTDRQSFPSKDGNADYEEFKRWRALDPINNLLQAADPVVAPRITKVTMRQARLALLGANLLTTVNAAIAAMPGAQGEAARIEWEYSQEVQRDRGLVSALGTQMGMTEAQLDALFAVAAAIP